MTITADFAAFVGIDWADQQHAICVLEDGLPRHTQVAQQAEALDAWAEELRQRYGDRPIAVCLEQSRGPLIAALAKYEFLVLFPLNPKQLARYREALVPSGAKDDPTDARWLAQFVAQYHGQLRPWQPDDETTRALRRLVEDRRAWVDARTALKNQLRQRLKEYFPLALELAPADLDCAWFLQLVRKFPTHDELRRASPKTLARFLSPRRRVVEDEGLDPRVTRIRAALPLTTDRALIAAQRLAVLQLVPLLERHNEAVAQYDREIARVFDQHADAELFRSLPGAGPGLAPRLAVALGSDRDRFTTADQVQALSGIAPLRQRSGQSCVVRRRRACPKFLHQTFHEYADHSRKKSAWAQAFYRMKRAAGCGHHATLRALAFKWIRIIFRCWTTRQPYHEARYLAALAKQQSPLLKFLEPIPNQTA